MITLKLADNSDINTVVDFAVKLVSDLPFSPVIELKKLRHTIDKVVNGDKNENIILIVLQDQTPVGVLGASVSRPLFCQEHEKMAVELLLYVLPDHRCTSALRELLRAYKYWARLVGCSYISYASYKNGIEMNRIRKLT